MPRCSSGAVESEASLERMSRQRSDCARIRRMSSARGSSGASSLASSCATSAIVASGVPSSCAAAAARPSSAERCCSRCSTSSVAGERIGELPRLLARRGTRRSAMKSERADERHPHAADIVQRHVEGLARETTAAARARRRATVVAASVIAPSRNVLSGGSVVAETMHRPEQQDGERVLQPAGQVEQAGELQRGRRRGARRPVRIEPVGRREDERAARD